MSDAEKVTGCEEAMASVALSQPNELPTSNTQPEAAAPSNVSDGVLAELAACIGAAERILVLTGAGISTSAGLPDFRSTSTGGRHINAITLSKWNLRQKPVEPTPTHRFVKLLSDKGKLKRWYTQNIDGLERRTGIASSALVECHGSLASPTAKCSTKNCAQRFRMADLEKALRKGKLLMCPQTNFSEPFACPDVVLYGDDMGNSYKHVFQDTDAADLMLIFGTSLQVAPVCDMPGLVPPSARKFWICREFPEQPYLLLPADMTRVHGSCDAVVEGLVERLGWQESFAAAAHPLPLV